MRPKKTNGVTPTIPTHINDEVMAKLLAEQAGLFAKQTPVIALTLQTLTIKREGQVEWMVEGDTHCGPKSELRDGKIAVKYSVSVTCEPHLDERGFLFDQAAVDLWMKRQASKPTKLSCEALVVDTAKEMLLKLARDVPHCKVKELIMTLQPSPFMAGITARFA